MALTNRLTHTAGSIIVHFQHIFWYFPARVSRPAGRSVLEEMIKFRSRKTSSLSDVAEAGLRPQVQYMGKIVDVPIVMQRQVPTIETVQNGGSATGST